MDYVTWRHCFLANAEEFFEEIVERSGEEYDPYDYVFEEESHYPDKEFINFDWDE